MRGSDATVNLLLNRASPWLNVDSHLPYEGKVLLRNKTTTRLSVRIPAWVPGQAPRCRLNGKDASPLRVGQFLVFEDLRPRNEVALVFPMKTETATYRMLGDEYTCTFKGNTLVGIEPAGSFGFRRSLREAY